MPDESQKYFPELRAEKKERQKTAFSKSEKNRVPHVRRLSGTSKSSAPDWSFAQDRAPAEFEGRNGRRGMWHRTRTARDFSDSREGLGGSKFSCDFCRERMELLMHRTSANCSGTVLVPSKKMCKSCQQFDATSS